MSDDLERRLREAGHRLPGPTDLETHRARARVLAPRGQPRLLPVLAAAAIAAGAFGVGYAVASGSTATKVVVKPTRLDVGPGFLPAPGWTTTQNGDHATATSASGVRIDATFVPASRHPGLPQRTLPFVLPRRSPVHLVAHVGAYAVEVTVTFTGKASQLARVIARIELGRLVVPSCPAALPLSSAGSVALYVRHWLPSHYSGRTSDLVGARAHGTLGRSMPRYQEAVADCGARVANRSVEVDVTLPRVAKTSASLSELSYFVARTPSGWTVWERAR